MPEDAFDRAVDAVDPERESRQRTVFSTGCRPPVEIRRNFSLRAAKSPTGVVRRPWEPVFPYACKLRLRSFPRPVERWVVQTYHDRPKRAWVTRYGPARPGFADRPGSAAESRSGGICPRRDDALPRRDRGGQRSARRKRLLPREPREGLSRGAGALRQGRARRRDHARRRARGAWRARGRRRPRPHPRAGRARSRERQCGPLRPHRAGDGHPARAHPRGRGDFSAGLGAAGRHHRPRRPRRAGRLRPLAGAGHDRVHATSRSC